MRYAIFEDEELSREQLKLSVERLRPGYTLDFSGESVQSAVNYFKGKPAVDLVFMDVQLSDGECFEIFKQVEPHAPVIFTTAYDNYALKAFKTDSIDYLLKPVSEAELALALAKFERKRPSAQEAAAAATAKPASDAAPRRILTVSGDNYEPLPLEEIAYFTWEENYVLAIDRQGGEHITTFTSLNDLLKILPENLFYQLTRSVITSIDSIAKISKYFRGRLMVKLSAGNTLKEVMVSAERRDDFLSWLGK